MSAKADVIARACAAIETASPNDAAALLNAHYPFQPTLSAGRRYTAAQCMDVFTRDGFIDRYSGQKLVFPGTLRLLSWLVPEAFPFQSNWKSDSCHFAYYELFPTIDHRVPVSRGGADHFDNWVTTSMLRNAAKTNFTVEELAWTVHAPGRLEDWDGLTGWFLRQWEARPDIWSDPYLSRWRKAALSWTAALFRQE